MEITGIRFRRLLFDGSMRAIVSITLDDAFVVHDVKVVAGPNGLFVAMPSRRTSNGEFRDIAHPINKEARAAIKGKILDAYFEAVAEAERNGLVPENLVEKISDDTVRVEPGFSIAE